MPGLALIWDDATRLGGVNTWLFQCVARLPARGLDAWVVDLGAQESGQVDISPWRHRVLTLRPGRWESPHAFRCRLRREFTRRDLRLAVFQEQRFGEDVLDALPPGFPAVNVLHVDRPDPRYWELALALDPRLTGQFAVSPRIRENLRSRLPESRRDRVLYLPLGVELPPPPPRRPPAPGGTLRLVYAGRISREQKRVQDLPDFSRALAAAGVRHQLDVYGDGPDLPALRADCAGLAPAVTWHGARPQSDILAALATAHVLVLFSEYEGLPLVLLEAMARGVLPLVTRIRSGISDLLEDGVNALLFPPGEPATAAAVLAAAAADPARFTALAQAARTTAEAFDLERCLDAYAERFHALLHAHPQPFHGPACADLRPATSWKARLAAHLPGRLTGAFS
jgi:glycosyltransferase involved in cell wall biosynthesis